MVDQLPRPALEAEDVGRALIESDHWTVGRTQSPSLGADRIAHLLSDYDAHVPLLDTAARIEPGHVQKPCVNLVPSDCVATGGAQVRDVRAMRPHGAKRSEVAMQCAVERSIKKHRCAANVFL